MAKSTGKAKPYTPATTWDMGSQTLAVLGDVPRIVREFRSHLMRNPKAREAVRKAEEPTGDKKADAARKQHAQRVTANWMRSNGYTPVIEPADYTDPLTGKKINPNGVKRARRIDMVEQYQRRGILEQRQVLAALAVRMAYEQTEKSPPAIKAIQVDTSPKPDQHIAILMDRISKFTSIFGLIHSKDRALLDCICVRGNGPGELKCYRGRNYRKGIEHMQEALTRLADALEL
ncbi:hypothetical protein [Roseovarius sp. MMSF_3350]|uniref:hypothetical protein n=1 Tax=Roseovarius sp. MMSF_3350 TaxID=3046706 RepID=UPI00273D1B5A|nr:hypothetical protein [Roseovarius sp. MMSF_3350]